MTPKQQYYKNIADTMISNLKKRGFEADYVPDRQAALRAIAPYLTKGNTVSCGGSITLTEIGFNTAVKEADCIFLDRTIAKTQEEKDAVYSKVAVCDYYFMSTNAITTDGLLVNIDGTGNRVASLIHGPKNVIIIAGMNKVCPDLDSAYKRVKLSAAPPNTGPPEPQDALRCHRSMCRLSESGLHMSPHSDPPPFQYSGQNQNSPCR